MRRGADAFANRDAAVEALERAGARALNGAAAKSIAKSARKAKPATEVPMMRKLDVVMADALDDTEREFDDELIEGTIGRGAMVVLYGDSNSGKTFAAIDLGAAVARGEWLGRATDCGLVVYLATESPASVAARLTAYRRHHGLRVPGFAIVRAPINLFDGKADTTAVIALVAELEREHGAKVALIIGDTLARMSADANENAGEDMGRVVRNVDEIRRATGAAFLVIHHSGKDAARGMRGWSGLRAATDTEIEVTADEATGQHAAEITKQRDLPGKGDRIGFKLLPVRLGVNRWGNERTSCVVLTADAPEKKKARARRPSAIAGAIVEFLTARGSGCAIAEMVKHFRKRYARGSVYREVDRMVDEETLLRTAHVIALPGNAAAGA